MWTKITKIEDLPKQLDSIKEAGKMIRDGKLVAFPTETVYGLGADAMNPKAVKKVFKAKNRPVDNPMIVHISDLKQLKTVAGKVPKSAKLFMKAFWPGPLSIVLPKNEELSDVVTAGLDTVVVRFPKHPIARALINESKTPIAAPSANLSGKVSPTRAEHVEEDLQGRVSLIIDGGEIEYGLESTVVDCTSNKPTILRPGSITIEELRRIIPETQSSNSKTTIRSPGTKYRHYAPEIPITLFVGSPQNTAKAISESVTKHGENSVVVLWHTGKFSSLSHNYRLPKNTYEAAPLLFHTLRTADIPKAKRILIQGYKTEEMGVAIMNRLEKAATKIIEV